MYHTSKYGFDFHSYVINLKYYEIKCCIYFRYLLIYP